MEPVRSRRQPPPGARELLAPPSSGNARDPSRRAATETEPPVDAPTFSDELLGLIAHRMRIIGEPARMRILLLLSHNDATVQEISDALRTAHQSTSKHLDVLYGAGVLSRTRAGSSVRYSIADYAALRLIEQTRASITGYIEELSHLAAS